LAREAKIYHLDEPAVKIDLKSGSLACFIFVLFGIMYFIEDVHTGQGESLLYQLGQLIQLTPSEKSDWILWIIKYAIFIVLGVINFLWIFNIFIWRWFVEYFIKPISRRSEAHYKSEGDHFGVIKIDVLNEYLDGDWQWSRYKWGLGGLLVIDLVLVPVSYNLLNTVTIASLFALFVTVFESWIWLERLRVGFCIKN
jgi:hypothetical protein